MPDKKDLFTIQEEPIVLQECIIVDKVYDSCFQRECAPEVVLTLPAGGPFTLLYVRFGSGFIVDGTLIITPIVNRPNFARVRFRFRVPFTAVLRDDCACPPVNIEILGSVEFDKDICMYIPSTPDEFSFKIVIETRSQVLRSEIIQGTLVLAIGIFVIIKVVGKVQLSVKSTGFCPNPRECEEIAPEDICEEFLNRPLPPFFPPQFTGGNCTP
jgi:hypothetical protein